MKSKTSIFEKFVLGDLNQKDLDGVRFLNQQEHEDTKIISNPEFIKSLELIVATQKIKETIKKIDEDKKKKEFIISFPWVKSLKDSRKIAAVAAFLVILAIPAILLTKNKPKNNRDLAGLSHTLVKEFKDKKTNLNSIKSISPILRKDQFPIAILKSIKSKEATALKLISPKSSNLNRICALIQLKNKSKYFSTEKSVGQKNEFENSGGITLKLKRDKFENFHEINENKKHFNDVASISGDNFGYKEKNLNKAIELDPKNTKLYIQRAWLNEQKHNYKKAEKDYEAAIKVDNNNVELHLCLAWFYQATGNYEKLERVYTKIIRINNFDPNSYLRRALYYKAMGLNSLAESDFNKLIKMEPLNPKWYELRAWFYEKTDQKWKEKRDRLKILKLQGKLPV